MKTILFIALFFLTFSVHAQKFSSGMTKMTTVPSTAEILIKTAGKTPSQFTTPVELFNSSAGAAKFLNKTDILPLTNYISGTDGQIPKFRGDSSVVGMTNGSEGQVLKIISGVATWGIEEIPELASAPATGNAYINSSSHRLWVKSGNYWRSLAWAADSVLLVDSKTLVDSYAASNLSASSNMGAVTGGDDAEGQCFTPNATGTIESVKFSLIKYGVPTGNAVVKLYAFTGAYGTDGIPTGTALATSDNFDVSTTTGSWAEYEITFSGANKYNMTAGTHYAISIEWSGVDVDNYIKVGYDSTSPTHEGNAYALDGGAYWPYSARDQCFSVYANVTN